MPPSVFFQKISKDSEIKKYIKPSFKQEIMEYLFYFFEVFVCVAIVYIFLRTSVFDVVGINGKSMFPNYNSNDAIYIDQLTPKFSDYRRGDVVVLLSPAQANGKKELYIKRIVGVPGDRVIFDGGKVYISNDNFVEPVELNESSYLSSDIKTFKKVISISDKFEEDRLGANDYFVMGDNRGASTDSRIFGKISKSEIIGKEFYRILPTDKAGFFVPPKYNISN